MLIFSDAFEHGEGADREVGICASLFRGGSQPLYCIAAVPETIIQHWLGDGRTKVINQAEMLPAVVARLTWHELLRGRMILHFIDSESAKGALIRGYSPVLASAMLIGGAWLLDEQAQACSWYDRVPSSSNVADEGSHYDDRGYRRRGWKRSAAILPTMRQLEGGRFAPPAWSDFSLGGTGLTR